MFKIPTDNDCCSNTGHLSTLSYPLKFGNSIVVFILMFQFVTELKKDHSDRLAIWLDFFFDSWWLIRSFINLIDQLSNGTSLITTNNKARFQPGNMPNYRSSTLLSDHRKVTRYRVKLSRSFIAIHTLQSSTVKWYDNKSIRTPACGRTTAARRAQTANRCLESSLITSFAQATTLINVPITHPRIPSLRMP